MGSFGWQELLIILGILVLLFGATRLPKLARSLGSSVRGFRKGMNEDLDDEDEEEEDEAAGKEKGGSTRKASAGKEASADDG